MYLEFFELNEHPFQLTPDPEFLYLGKGHARAKAYMDYTIWNRDSFVVITGEIGSGKTTLIRHLLSTLDENVIVAKLHQTQLNEIEFYQAVLVEFGFKPFSASKVELIDMLNTYLAEQYSQRRQVVLIIDEAQNLSPRVLEEVRLMTGLETHKEKILNLILVGQPELKELLDAPGMEQLNQRIRFRFHLKALTEEETKEYIDHRLAVAGNETPDLFPPATLPVIHRYTGGVPRLINTLCDTALISAFVEDQRDITVELVEDAIEELQWTPYSERAKRHISSLQEAIQYSTQIAPKLLIYKKGNKFEEFLLDKEVVTLGRLPGNDIMLNDTVVSGHHAKILTLHGTSFLEDLDSTNGTFVNSERVKKCVLKNGDIISLARCRLKYVNETQSEDAADNAQVTNLKKAR
jgi:putative secretion ATPase (PEP-CTERM system associated)